LLALALLLFASALDESPTTDEARHLLRGLGYFWGPDASLSIAHPPLGNAIAALPVVIGHRKLELQRVPGYARAEAWTVAEHVLSKRYERRRQWFFEARMMVAALTLGMTFYLYRWATRLFGVSVGLLTLFFLATHPTLIAHGRLVTTDMPVTVTFVLALAELVLYLRGGSRWHAAAAALLTGAAPVVKYSGALAVPVALALTGAAALARLGRYRKQTRAAALRSAACYGLCLIASVLFVINATYRFDRTGWTVEAILNASEPAAGRGEGFSSDLLERHSFVAKLPPWLHVPLPYTFIFGLATLQEHAATGHQTVFFGKQLAQGHIAYFPVMLAIKTPVLQLAGLACALWILARERGRVSPVCYALAAAAGSFLWFAMRSSINIGVRHVLPVVPILTLFAALGLVCVWRAYGLSRKPSALPLTAAVLAAHLIGMSWAFPDYISDFNLLVAGRAGGERISIVGEEWDQDILRLARQARAHGVRELYFASESPITTSLELRRHGVEMRPHDCSTRVPAGAYVGVSARSLARDRTGCWQWTRDQTPVLQVDEHLFVYQRRDDS